jgi:hypothetical protein
MDVQNGCPRLLVDWDYINDPVPDEIRKEFPEVGEELKASFSKLRQPRMITL